MLTGATYDDLVNDLREAEQNGECRWAVMDVVYKSVNGGASWAPIVGTGATALPALPVHTIVVDPTNTQRLYVGTDAGVFTSIDGGLNWYKEVTGFANVVTESLGINTTGTKRLFAFTHGRSAWRVDLQP